MYVTYIHSCVTRRGVNPLFFWGGSKKICQEVTYICTYIHIYIYENYVHMYLFCSVFIHTYMTTLTILYIFCAFAKSEQLICHYYFLTTLLHIVIYTHTLR